MRILGRQGERFQVMYTFEQRGKNGQIVKKAQRKHWTEEQIMMRAHDSVRAHQRQRRNSRCSMEQRYRVLGHSTRAEDFTYGVVDSEPTTEDESQEGQGGSSGDACCSALPPSDDLNKSVSAFLSEPSTEGRCASFDSHNEEPALLQPVSEGAETLLLQVLSLFTSRTSVPEVRGGSEVTFANADSAAESGKLKADREFHKPNNSATAPLQGDVSVAADGSVGDTPAAEAEGFAFSDETAEAESDRHTAIAEKPSVLESPIITATTPHDQIAVSAIRASPRTLYSRPYPETLNECIRPNVLSPFAATSSSYERIVSHQFFPEITVRECDWNGDTVTEEGSMLNRIVTTSPLVYASAQKDFVRPKGQAQMQSETAHEPQGKKKSVKIPGSGRDRHSLRAFFGRLAKRLERIGMKNQVKDE
uniref:Uncharacterized protein n=1 Tax=Chromera velia CCMP2878 TaxID=1169474 RepID=A0A0G4G1N8_9ALVE|eukprot:Cvel_19700.t1-p1 / transcript=Cvel_19700.t1 / gene=Cvel_19700 / organism=Chromera_velia_CCMP2878 / gene_product=hypothetical protein / transcript_product=hypothetical protein / location=Cvel_scaffold1719:36187-38506(-) / protein_length=418 / sequence_SO=supercontig / SO=protein_coding / is_pseudo=false